MIMQRDVVNRIWELREQMKEDSQYRELMNRREYNNAQFLAVLDTLTKEQEAGILDYVGYLLEMHYKIMEYLVK